jgi:mono/diheme cytochrome c family protein
MREGLRAPDAIRGSPRTEKLASTDYVLSVLVGGLKSMPPIASMMSDAQVADVVNYVRTNFGNAYPDAVSAADVAAERRSATPP